MAAAVLSAVALTDEDYLEQARWICKRVPTVWFDLGYKFDPKARASAPVYRIYRRGMGKVAERASPAALVAYLRKQLPPS